LRDYAHKEWSGLLRDLYRPRWEAFFTQLRKELDGAPAQALDYYAMEEPWTLAHNPYAAEPEGDCVDVARAVFEEVMNPENDF
jgi:alpha-N-acetylglucosaminidase